MVGPWAAEAALDKPAKRGRERERAQARLVVQKVRLKHGPMKAARLAPGPNRKKKKERSPHIAVAFIAIAIPSVDVNQDVHGFPLCPSA